jgi:Ala-tRNA(Pro) deacylase
MNIQQFLTERGVEFEMIRHRDTYSAQRMAQELHVPGRDVAKTVLLRANHGYRYLVAVLPATRRIDLELAAKAVGGGHAELATEIEVAERFPDCEFGALPPFGSQYGLLTLVDASLADEESIVFEGNTHGESIRMRFDDFRKIEEPLIVEFTRNAEKAISGRAS